MIGEFVKHYKIIERIGKSGSYTVYKALDTKYDRLVVLKFLSAQPILEPDIRDQFLQEGLLITALKHEYICTLYEISHTENGQLFFVMEYIDGETLKERLERGLPGYRQAILWAKKIAQGLAEAHQQGIIHGDIKPANTMITETGEIKILGFATGKFLNNTNLTKTALKPETAAYMSPEQIQGRKIDDRTDLWSLGVLTFEMLSGILPFNGETDQAMADAIVNKKPNPHFENRTDIPKEIKHFINKSLEKDTVKRYQSASEMINDLSSEGVISEGNDETVFVSNETISNGNETVIVGFKSLHGLTIGNYRILEEIGRGGMGIVYKGLDINLEKVVAIKVMAPNYQMDDDFIKRFRGEAKALAKLESTHIVHVYALNVTEQGIFIVMEYVDGINLDRMIKENGPIPWQKAIGYCRQLLRALNHAHKAQVIHRDIKPSNVLVTKDGVMKLTDFGLAKIKKREGPVTQTKFSAGTLYYMSPEQIRNPRMVDIRGDIYALGMTFYEMLIGKLPFNDSTSEFNIQKSIIEDVYPRLSKINSEIPEKFSAIIAKCIEKKPENRYQSVQEVLQEMDALDRITSHDKKPAPKPAPKYWMFKTALLSIFSIVIIWIGFLIHQSFFPDNSNSTPDPPDPVDYGKLEIRTRPEGAAVLIDGFEKGMSPCNIDSLVSGAYGIIIKKQGYEIWETSKYEIYEGSVHTLNIDLIKEKPIVKARVLLDIIPAKGSIYIDHKKYENIVRESLEPGRYSLRFNHPDYGAKDTSITIVGGENIKLTCYFQQSVNIISFSENGKELSALIKINNEIKEAWTPSELVLSPGEYRISISKWGYQTTEQEILLNVKPSFQKITHHKTFQLRPVDK